MKTKKKKPKLTKVEIKEVNELENPEFIVAVSIVTYENLKRWNLIDSKILKKYLKKKIETDYNGGDVNE